MYRDGNNDSKCDGGLKGIHYKTKNDAVLMMIERLTVMTTVITISVMLVMVCIAIIKFISRWR